MKVKNSNNSYSKYSQVGKIIYKQGKCSNCQVGLSPTSALHKSITGMSNLQQQKKTDKILNVCIQIFISTHQ